MRDLLREKEKEKRSDFVLERENIQTEKRSAFGKILPVQCMIRFCSSRSSSIICISSGTFFVVDINAFLNFHIILYLHFSSSSLASPGTVPGIILLFWYATLGLHKGLHLLPLPLPLTPTPPGIHMVQYHVSCICTYTYRYNVNLTRNLRHLEYLLLPF